MKDSQFHFSSKHMLVCVAMIVVVVVALLAGAGSGILFIALVCPLMMGAMVWMMVGGMGGRGGSS